MSELAPLALIVVAALAVLAAVLWQRRRVVEARTALARRDGLQVTDRPCGLTASGLVDRFGCPRGARRFGVEHAVQGPVEVEIDDEPTTAEVAAFQWWYEERVRNQQRTTYRRRTCVVALAQLPRRLDGWVEVRPASVLGRIGLTRGGDQLESEEFNRRFRVEGSDRRLTVRLLDAWLQHHLLEHGQGRTLHMEGTRVGLAGTPSSRDTTLAGVIGRLPPARDDLTALLRAVPASLWRATDRVERPRGGGQT